MNGASKTFQANGYQMKLGTTIQYIPLEIIEANGEECAVRMKWPRDQRIDPDLFLFEASLKEWSPTNWHASYLTTGDYFWETKPLFDGNFRDESLYKVYWNRCYDKKGEYNMEDAPGIDVLHLLKDPYRNIMETDWNTPLQDGEHLNIPVFMRINMDKWQRMKWARDSNYDPRSIWLQIININSRKRLVLHLGAVPGGIKSFEWSHELENEMQTCGLTGVKEEVVDPFNPGVTKKIRLFGLVVHALLDTPEAIESTCTSMTTKAEKCLPNVAIGTKNMTNFLPAEEDRLWLLLSPYLRRDGVKKNSRKKICSPFAFFQRAIKTT